MQRTLMRELIKWKDNPSRKPLILKGARQVGKTWLLKEFGAREFPDVAYIRMEDNEAMRSLFEGSLNPQRLLEGMAAWLGKGLTRHTFIILDEIQAVPRALTALKYFNEDAPEYAIAAAGSLLGVALNPGISFPVGKVNFLDLYPMSFTEFLLAEGAKNLCELISGGDFSMIDVFAEQLTDKLKQYYYVGGMPEAVLEHSTTKDIQRVRTIQNDILATYERDFGKHTSKETAERCREIWQSIPSQLAKENKKFIYGMAGDGRRGRDYKGALQFLSDCGLVHLIPRVSKAGIPLEAYKSTSGFKLYITDVGLLGAMSGLDSATLVEGAKLFQEFKGAYTEQFVCQELVSTGGFKPYYWSAENSSGEIDFLLQEQGMIYPIEVKSATNVRSRSLSAFCKRYDLDTGVRLSLSRYRDEGWMRNVPLYAIGALRSVLLRRPSLHSS
ncbi:MAG: ATP-binding protein [Actinomycetia bacterium]|nr:ATP-binding protein [Actinomycetes bacterium]